MDVLCFNCGMGFVYMIPEAFWSDVSDFEAFEVINIERVDFGQHFEM